MTPEEAVEKALLYTFQLSGKDYRKMQTAMSEVAFIRALQQDGFTVVREGELDVEPGLLWWCPGWGTLNAQRYHGVGDPCTEGCGVTAYYRARLTRQPEGQR